MSNKAGYKCIRLIFYKDDFSRNLLNFTKIPMKKYAKHDLCSLFFWGEIKFLTPLLPLLYFVCILKSFAMIKIMNTQTAKSDLCRSPFGYFYEEPDHYSNEELSHVF